MDVTHNTEMRGHKAELFNVKPGWTCSCLYDLKGINRLEYSMANSSKALFTPDEYSAETVVIYSGEQQSWPSKRLHA